MLGARIAALRRSRGMSQSQLAQELGVSPSAIGMYEQGRREPSTSMVVALSEIFQVSTDYLLTGKPTQPGDRLVLTDMVEELVDLTQLRLESRRDKPFTRQELALLLAAMLTEPCRNAAGPYIM